MKNLYWGKTIGSILIILLLMQLGHALMIIMEHTLEPTTLHYSAFAMGFVGLIVTICGVFVKGDAQCGESRDPYHLYGIWGQDGQSEGAVDVESCQQLQSDGACGIFLP